ncbi:Reverse transcriptase zinc-binding domain [Sesbania bispinosa]|nr:Reverse transcriptase zinc-binding domain [Sesbania bispinosa]
MVPPQLETPTTLKGSRVKPSGPNKQDPQKGKYGPVPKKTSQSSNKDKPITHPPSKKEPTPPQAPATSDQPARDLEVQKHLEREVLAVMSRMARKNWETHSTGGHVDLWESLGVVRKPAHNIDPGPGHMHVEGGEVMTEMCPTGPIEPRISGEKADQVIKKIGFNSTIRVDAIGFLGGYGACGRYMLVLILASVKPYGRNLRDSGDGHSKPWCALGDVKTILFEQEKEGELLVHSLRGKEGQVREKLDRVVANDAWRIIFQTASIRNVAYQRQTTEVYKTNSWKLEIPSLLNFKLGCGKNMIKSLLKEAYWLHHSRVNWLQLGDRNTRFIHALYTETVHEEIEWRCSKSFPEGFSEAMTYLQHPPSVEEIRQSFLTWGRQGTDNVLALQEVIHSMHKLKVDMAKAHDRMRWSFITDTLHATGLPDHLLFCSSSGQEINHLKSMVYFSPNAKQPLRTETLSFAGRITLAQSAVMSIPGYIMQACKTPVSICDEVERLCRDFIWGSNADKKRVHLVSWDSICKPKSHGGLGFRSLKILNEAYTLKLAWHLINRQDLLRVQIMRTKYKSGSIAMPRVKAHGTDSHIWKAIVKVWPKLEEATLWIIGNGKDVNFWNDNFLPGRGPLRLYTTCDIPHWMTNYPASFFAEGGEWKVEVFNQYLPLGIVNEIIAVRAPRNDLENDVPAWKFNANGTFNLKGAYDILVNLPGSDFGEDLVKHIWKWPSSPRIKLFLWKVMHGKLMCNVERKHRRLTEDDCCQRCGESPESIMHHS